MAAKDPEFIELALEDFSIFERRNPVENPMGSVYVRLLARAPTTKVVLQLGSQWVIMLQPHNLAEAEMARKVGAKKAHAEPLHPVVDHAVRADRISDNAIEMVRAMAESLSPVTAFILAHRIGDLLVDFLEELRATTSDDTDCQAICNSYSGYLFV